MLAFMKISALIKAGSLVSCSRSELICSAYVDCWKKKICRNLLFAAYYILADVKVKICL
jgi:hypothetical protein